MPDLITILDFDKWGLPADSDIDASVKASACSSASAWAMGFLRARYPNGFSAWGDDVREQCCAHAAIVALQVTGFNPEAAQHITALQRDKAAERWFTRVAERIVHPDVTELGAAHNAPLVLSDESRGW